MLKLDYKLSLKFPIQWPLLQLLHNLLSDVSDVNHGWFVGFFTKEQGWSPASPTSWTQKQSTETGQARICIFCVILPQNTLPVTSKCGSGLLKQRKCSLCLIVTKGFFFHGFGCSMFYFYHPHHPAAKIHVQRASSFCFKTTTDWFHSRPLSYCIGREYFILKLSINLQTSSTSFPH